MESCGICGNSHSTYSCNTLHLQNHVADKLVPTKAKLTLPGNFSLELMIDGRIEVIAKEKITKGTYFGPLDAPKLITLNPAIVFPLKLFSAEVEDLQESFLDTTDENECNWLMFINPASCIEEQNMICFQDNSSIIYAVIKDIERGECLKVWYSSHYGKKMKEPELKSREFLEELPKTYCENELNNLITKQQKIKSRENWTCKFCSKLETNVIKFAHHMIEHYSQKIFKVCVFCKERFPTKISLRKHIRIAHPKTTHKKKKRKEKKKLTKAQKTVQGLVGGPLLNNLLFNDSLDVPNLSHSIFEFNSFDLNASGQICFLESDYSNLIESNDKELNDFDFKIDEMENDYVCDICLKPFSKLKCLLQHLRSHTGRFTCNHCSKVFTRNENLKAHVCSEKTIYKCDFCDRIFPLTKYLRRHVKITHGSRVTCPNCKKHLSEYEYESHKCLTEIEKKKYECPVCQKCFSFNSSLHKHRKSHERRKDYICEICAKTFISRTSLQMHVKMHKVSPSFSCKECKRKFARKDMYLAHMELHKNEASYFCEICNRPFKTQKYLAAHKRTHVKNTTQAYHCSYCDAKFTAPINLRKHLTRHKTTCRTCKKEFKTSTDLKEHVSSTHFTSCYPCPLCKTVLKFRGSLARHIKNKHTQKSDQKATKELTNLLNSFIDAEKSESVFKSLVEQEGHFNEGVVTLYSGEKDNELFTEYDSNLVASRTDASSMDNNLDDIVRNLENVVNIYNKSSCNEMMGLNDNTQQQQQNKTNFETYKNHSMLIDLQDLDLGVDVANVNLQQNVNFENLQQTNSGCLSMPDLNESNLDTISAMH